MEELWLRAEQLWQSHGSIVDSIAAERPDGSHSTHRWPTIRRHWGTIRALCGAQLQAQLRLQANRLGLSSVAVKAYPSYSRAFKYARSTTSAKWRIREPLYSGRAFSRASRTCVPSQQTAVSVGARCAAHRAERNELVSSDGWRTIASTRSTAARNCATLLAAEVRSTTRVGSSTYAPPTLTLR